MGRLAVLFLIFSFSFIGFAQQGMPSKIQKELGPTYLHFDPGFLQNKSIDSNEIATVWSRTMDSVVIGRAFRGEYIQDNDTTTRLAILYPMLLGNSYVTKGEFLEFRQWIQDSIAREQLFFGVNENADARKFVLENKIIDEEYGNDREQRHYYFDWRVKLEYEAEEYVPILADMYYPQPERFRKNRTIDVRKMYYRANDELRRTWSTYPVLVDSYNWALEEHHSFSLGTVLAFLDDQLYRDEPITNIEPFMAEAYCHWKSEQLTKLLGSEKKRVVCRLPSASEVEYIQKSETATLEIPTYDHSEEWAITNREFHTFSAYVLDSSRREYLYSNLEDDEEALALLNFTERYFSEGALEFQDVDPKKRAENRYYFNFDAKKKLKLTNPMYVSLLAEFSFKYQDSIRFRYSWLDAIDRSLKGELMPDPYQKRRDYGHYLVLAPITRLDNEWNGEDLILDGWGRDDGFGTRDHENYQRFHRQEIIAVPYPNDIPTNEAIADITYEQALAYYNWKFRIDQYSGDETGNWQQFVFPTEAEFDRIKKGERIVHPATSIAYEFPVFRMVVEMVPR